MSWYHHQPESHQQSFTKSWTDIERPGPIDRTPETPGSGNNNCESNKTYIFLISQVDPNALIGDKLKAMSEALASGEPLPEIDNNDLGGDADC